VTAALVLRVDVDASPEEVFAGATDWTGQGEWMLGTKVWPTKYRGVGTGASIAAWTGVGPLGFVDTMDITRWEPPRACHVKHTGTVVKGTGAFEVEPRGDGLSTFVWSEQLELPFGALGRAGWPLAKPLFAAGVQVSLRRFARWVEAGRPHTAA
jgi:Polyketide cyclase / dehydrase and lipid transport